MCDRACILLIWLCVLGLGSGGCAYAPFRMSGADPVENSRTHSVGATPVSVYESIAGDSTTTPTEDGEGVVDGERSQDTSDEDSSTIKYGIGLFAGFGRRHHSDIEEAARGNGKVDTARHGAASFTMYWHQFVIEPEVSGGGGGPLDKESLDGYFVRVDDTNLSLWLRRAIGIPRTGGRGSFLVGGSIGYSWVEAWADIDGPGEPGKEVLSSSGPVYQLGAMVEFRTWRVIHLGLEYRYRIWAGGDATVKNGGEAVFPASTSFDFTGSYFGLVFRVH